MPLRPRLIRAIATLALASLPLAAAAQTAAAPAATPVVAATETSGVKFDNELALRGSKLLLNGAGTRYKW